MQNKDILVILLGGEIHFMFWFTILGDLLVWPDSPEMSILLDYTFKIFLTPSRDDSDI